LHKKIPLASINPSLLKNISYKKVNGKTIAFLGRRAIGYPVLVGLSIEAIMLAGWATDWVTSPAQDKRMKQRAIAFESILEGD
jgi:hypothetical protein